MNTRYNHTLEHDLSDLRQASRQAPPLRPSYLHFVSPQEMQELRQALLRGELPPDFEAKLSGLAEGDLMCRFVARNCRLFVTLLRAAQGGAFREASRDDRERLLRVLAYVRKDDDAIADYKPGGFMDDQAEVRAAMAELHPALKAFKAWHLRHQVPGMWSN